MLQRFFIALHRKFVIRIGSQLLDEKKVEGFLLQYVLPTTASPNNNLKQSGSKEIISKITWLHI